MQRRKFLIGAGSAAVGASALIGSGAFTSVEAERTVAISVADDSDAFLALDATASTTDFVYQDGDEIAIELDGSDGDGSGTDASGLNPNATTTLEEAFTVTNQGSQEVEVSLNLYTDTNRSDENELSDAEYGAITFQASDDDDIEGDLTDGLTFGSGATATVGITLDTTDGNFPTEDIQAGTFHATTND